MRWVLRQIKRIPFVESLISFMGQIGLGHWFTWALSTAVAAVIAVLGWLDELPRWQVGILFLGALAILAFLANQIYGLILKGRPAHSSKEIISAPAPTHGSGSDESARRDIKVLFDRIENIKKDLNALNSSLGAFARLRQYELLEERIPILIEELEERFRQLVLRAKRTRQCDYLLENTCADHRSSLRAARALSNKINGRTVSAEDDDQFFTPNKAIENPHSPVPEMEGITAADVVHEVRKASELHKKTIALLKSDMRVVRERKHSARSGAVSTWLDN